MAVMQHFDAISNKFNGESSVLKLCMLPLALPECCIVVVIAVAFRNLKFQFGPEVWYRSMVVFLISLNHSRVMPM
jgi:ABC-type spermidine/putrescine transport system permease subunit II